LLVAEKEYAATLQTKADEKQASLLAKLEQAMEQNTKLLSLMAKGGFNTPKNEPNNQHGGGNRSGARKGKKEPRVCGNCGEEGYHEDDDCFGLEKNKAKRPAWYIKKHGE